MQNCQNCPLAEIRIKNNLLVLPGCGSKTAPIMLIAEAPAKFESQQREPMASYYGAMLKRALEESKLDPALIWKDNIVKCPPIKDKSPNALPTEKDKTRAAYVEEEIQKCFPYLEATINEIKPKLIIAAGDASFKFLSGNRKLNIKKNHGQLYKMEKYNCYLMGTFHPKVILAEYDYIKYMIQDFKNAKQFLEVGEPKVSETNYIFANDKQKLSSVLDQLSKQVAFSFDIETTGLNFLTDKILCIGFSWAEHSGAVIPLCDDKGDPFWDEITLCDIKNTLSNVFANEALKIGYNGSFDVLFLKKYGFTINNFSFDPMLAHHLLDENARGMRSLKHLALLYTDMGNYDEPLDVYKAEHKIPAKSGMLNIPPELLAKYCAADVDCTLRLYNIFKDKLEKEDLTRLFNKITMPVCNVLIDTKYRGVRVDLEYMQTLRQKFEKRKQELEVDLHALNGGPFNLDSTPQLREFLYNKLNLVPIVDKRTGADKLTAGGEFATDIDVLQELARKCKSVNILIEYRKINKYLGTFINGLEYDLDSRVHTSYNIAGTTSGRLSSSGPNLQNIPRDETIKHMFCAKDGYTLVSCDLSAAEFRAWGHYSQDQVLITDIKSDFDIHRATASKVFNIPEDQITKEQRTAAKRVVFGLMFGQGVEATADQNGLTITQARNVIYTFFRKYPRAQQWLSYIVVKAKQDRELINLFGRKRRFLGFDSIGEGSAALCERQAKNFLMQSTVADITNFAAVRLFPILRAYDSYLVLQVHDALIYEVPDRHVDTVKNIIQKEVTKPIKGYTVPIAIELKVGKHWDS